MDAQPQPDAAPFPGATGSSAVVEYAREARRLVFARYPDALGAVLGGSSASGRATPGSDLDIAVLLPDGGISRREVFRHEGRPAEVFLHTRADLGEVFAEARATRRATALFIYAESVLLYDPDGHVETRRAEAQALLAAGPEPLTPNESELGRFLLTDLLDDLAETGPGSDRHEQLAIADRTLQEAAHLLTAYHRAWNGAGKWLPRRLTAADPVLGRELLRGHLALAERADPAPLTTAARRVLELLGGPLREGYVAPWRPSAGNGAGES
ncbi:nucleotidyltransferase [Streptomyces bingchenggensis BCW-1]|uniref:Nucleotidyltransferase n=1 Tax=Streptomyces bingchenggensis (strain BCW-1) TaxID=749414 RepID=D7CF20_STRBB|nr:MULTISPECIES: nucleotidyltransferase domain-containing protein [Streptomyces]ADI11042.1 nucleotidyltransferase [Streptomyces bingchenggensis BCW-1]